MGAKATRLDFIRYTQFGVMTACMINGGENGAFSSHLPWYHGDSIDRFPMFVRKGAIIPLAKDDGITYLVSPKGTTTRMFYLPTGDGTDYEECYVSYSFYSFVQPIRPSMLICITAPTLDGLLLASHRHVQRLYGWHRQNNAWD